MEDSTEVQSSELSTSMCSYENLPNHELDNLKQDHEVVIVIHIYSSSSVRVNALNPSDIAKIHFHEVPIPEFTSPPPDFNALRKFPLHHNHYGMDLCFCANILLPFYMKSPRNQDVSLLFMIILCPLIFRMFLPCPMLNLIWGMSIQLEEEFLKKLPSLEGVVPDEVYDFIAIQVPYMDIRSGSILNTSKVIEGEFIDSLAQAERIQQWAIV
ncbi:hypothetical protein CQW23_08686 [Capsicum baccatum]|uniref:Glycosyltransferase N-terminal domain-containing protein n=1 Tax=Capsicum baccatum TaxID=33114 RepID=A0A2G2X9N3_CAPBA|nr:hypothetical protein CQW23_08686 [Capsicum baccatum]